VGSLDQMYEGPAGAAPGERRGPSAQEALDKARRTAQQPAPVVEVPDLSDVQRQILTDVEAGKIPKARVSLGSFEVEPAKEADVPYRLGGTQVRGGNRTPYLIGGEESDISKYTVATDYGTRTIRDISDIVPGKGVLFQVDADEGDTREVFVPMERLSGTMRDAAEEIDRQRREAQAPEAYPQLTKQQASAIGSFFSHADAMELAALNTPFYQYMREEAEAREDERQNKQGDAVGYAHTAGPYEGQDLTDEEVYEASAEDFDNARDNYDEVASRAFDGVEVIEFDDGSVFMDAGEGVINVTGHPGYDPNHEDYYGPPVDEEE